MLHGIAKNSKRRRRRRLEKLTNMGVLTLCIILIFTSDLITAKPVQNNNDEVSFEHLSGLQEYQSMDSILTNYVEYKFPHLDKEQQSRIKIIVVHRIRMKIMSKLLTRPWYGNLYLYLYISAKLTMVLQG